jgi:hypothetical protein
MGKFVGGGTRFLLFCTLLSLIWLMPTEAFAFGEAISVSPSSGPAGQSVTIFGTGWHEHAIRGLDVPIWIGFANVVGTGHPDPNANDTFIVKDVKIPLNPPPQEIVNGKLRISAIIGNGGSADAFYTISNTPLTGCVDAYFIGVHGSIERPDPTNNNLPASTAIVETLNTFDALAREKGKVIVAELISYHAPDWADWLNDIKNSWL